MSRRAKIILGLGLALAAVAGGATIAAAQESAVVASARAGGLVGEQADGYLGVVGSVDSSLRAQVDAINIKRRAFYTELASKRGAKIEEVAATTACEIFASKVQAGQYYRLSDGVWRQRDAGAAVQRPGYCGS